MQDRVGRSGAGGRVHTLREASIAWHQNWTCKRRRLQTGILLHTRRCKGPNKIGTNRKPSDA